MQEARKAGDEHKQEKHNNSCAYKSGAVSDVPLGHERNTNPDPVAPTWEPWAKWVEMQQQSMVAVKGAQNAPKNPIAGTQLGPKKQQSKCWGPKGKAVTEIIMQLEAIKIKLGGVIETGSNALTARVQGICDMSTPVARMQDL